jgi:quercetin dioxygenase-like cupin family protein
MKAPKVGLDDGYVLGPDEGEAHWFLGHRMTFKAAGEPHGGLTVIQVLAPVGYTAPRHRHRVEVEAFYILEGEVSVTCGDQNWKLTKGCFAMLPRDVPHSLTIVGDSPASFLLLTTPAQFARFVAEVGRPAEAPGLPPRGPDGDEMARLFVAAPKYGITLLEPIGTL